MRLQGKTALITGGTAGIGRAIADAFTHESARVVITGRNAMRGQAVEQAIVAVGGQATYLQSDASSLEDIRRLARETAEILGHVDILVNNVGIYRFAPAAQTAEADFDAMMSLNVKGPFFLTAALVPAMVERGTGKIINITTMAAYFGLPGAAAYGASKAAVDLLTKAWAAEYGPSGVNVNAISPGPVRTEGAAVLGNFPEQMAAQAPAGRLADPREIAALAVYLASEDAAYVHGATIPVDGGRTAI